MLIPVPKSTTTQASPKALVGGDRVDKAVGADLQRIVDANRHPSLDARPDRQAVSIKVALGQLLILGAERRHHGGDADGVEIVEGHPAEGQEPGDPLGQLVAGRPRTGLEAPVLGQPIVVEGAEVGLGVADVDREKHGRRLCCLASGRTALRDPGLTPEHRRGG